MLSESDVIDNSKGLGRQYAQFSVTIGFMSRTTTVTLRTANVLASSSPMPEAPLDFAQPMQCETADTHLR